MIRTPRAAYEINIGSSFNSDVEACSWNTRSYLYQDLSLPKCAGQAWLGLHDGKSEAEVRLIRKKQFAYVCTMSCRPTMDWQGVN